MERMLLRSKETNFNNTGINFSRRRIYFKSFAYIPTLFV